VMTYPGDELPPVVVIAKADSLSIRKGGVYQFREYTPQSYERHGYRVPRSREGTLEGVGGGPPCCVNYPKHYTEPVDPPAEFDWL